jgi:hypothetical protein
MVEGEGQAMIARTWLRLRPVLAACVIAAMGSTAAWAQFTPGSIVVSVSGMNPTAGDASIAPLSLLEFTAAGDLTGTVIQLPMFDIPLEAGTNYAIVGSRAPASLQGALKRSVDGRFLTITAANVPADTPASSLPGGVYSSSSFANRTIARIDADGAVDTTTRFAARGTTPRGVASTDGSRLWWAANSGSGDAGGVRYLTLGDSVAGPLLTGVGLSTASRSNTNGIGIFADQIYVPYTVSPFLGVYALGNGLPESGGPLTATPVVSGISSVTDFFFADADTLYVSVSNTDSEFSGLGLQKWGRAEGGSWINVWTSNPAGTFGIVGLAGSVVGEVVDLYAVTFSGSDPAGRNTLVKLTDTFAGSEFPLGGFSTLATSSPDSLFRGVALAPVPEPSAVVLGLAGLASVCGFGRWRTRTRR